MGNNASQLKLDLPTYDLGQSMDRREEIRLAHAMRELLENETAIQDWQAIAQTAIDARTSSSQIRQVENVAHACLGWSVVVNYLFNLIARNARQRNRFRWAADLAEAIKGLPELIDTHFAQELISDRVLLRQRLILQLLHSRIDGLVAYFLFKKGVRP